VTTNIQLAKQIAKHVQLQTVVLRRADLTANFDPLQLPLELSLTQGYRAQCDAGQHGENGRISVSVDFKFDAKHEDEADSVSLEATFLLIYEIDKQLSLDPICLDHFASVNGPYNAWPYWRELVQTATGRVGLASIVVPVFRPPEYEVDNEKCVDVSLAREDKP
jgi:hypothetical protein